LKLITLALKRMLTLPTLTEVQLLKLLILKDKIVIQCMYKKLNIDRKKLTTMGVKFSAFKFMESTANAMGTNKFKGFEPSNELI